jgi:hypothetical protein
MFVYFSVSSTLFPCSLRVCIVKDRKAYAISVQNAKSNIPSYGPNIALIVRKSKHGTLLPQTSSCYLDCKPSAGFVNILKRRFVPWVNNLSWKRCYTAAGEPLWEGISKTETTKWSLLWNWWLQNWSNLGTDAQFLDYHLYVPHIAIGKQGNWHNSPNNWSMQLIIVIQSRKIGQRQRIHRW